MYASSMQWIAAARIPCACSEFTRITIGPLSVPVGIMTLVFGLIAAIFLPAMLWGLALRRREARAINAILLPMGEGEVSSREPSARHEASVYRSGATNRLSPA